MRTKPSIIYETCQRFDRLKAIGVSRHAMKQQLREAAAKEGVPLPRVAPSTGMIHSDGTLDTYKAIALRYVQLTRQTFGVASLAELDADAPWFVSAYLHIRIAADDSPYTLATTRSALRMFHRPAYPPDEREERVRQLGADVELPKRHREEITRSRGPVAMDDDLALHRYAIIESFAIACGLRRKELRAVTACAVHLDASGHLAVKVTQGKGGKERIAPVARDREGSVLRVIADKDPDAVLFPRIPVRLDIASCRRVYAMALYTDNDRYPLPPAEGRLPVGSIDHARALWVARALGHNRVDVVLRHYLR